MRHAFSVFGVALLPLNGCVSWFMKDEPLKVLVTNVTLLEATAFEQRLQADLRIRNPNDFDLHMAGINFKFDVNGKRLVHGLDNKELTIPRLSDAVVTVQTNTSTFDIIRQAFSLSQKPESSLE